MNESTLLLLILVGIALSFAMSFRKKFNWAIQELERAREEERILLNERRLDRERILRLQEHPLYPLREEYEAQMRELIFHALQLTGKPDVTSPAYIEALEYIRRVKVQDWRGEV